MTDNNKITDVNMEKTRKEKIVLFSAKNTTVASPTGKIADTTVASPTGKIADTTVASPSRSIKLEIDNSDPLHNKRTIIFYMKKMGTI